MDLSVCHRTRKDFDKKKFFLLFLAAATVRRIEAFHQLVTVDDRLIALFNSLDEDKDGVLNEKELEKAIQKVSPQVQQLVRIRSLLEISDLNNDGVIDV